MGLYDRDWYRESFAKKTGRTYNVKDATYSPKRFRGSKAVVSSGVHAYDRVVPRKIPTMHPLLTFLATMAVILFVWLALKGVIHLARFFGYL